MKRCTVLTAVVIPFLASVILFQTISQAAPAAAPDIRLILQTQGGLAAYTALTSTVNLANARQLLATIEDENAAYVRGDYLLNGRSQAVKLVIGQAGWIVAYHPPDHAVERLFDCTNSFTISQIENQPERAIMETAAALGVSPTIGFYDFRHPAADAITLHWLYMAQSGSAGSAITLPLSNLYLERGHAFCTALSNSEFWLNGQRIAYKGSVSSPFYLWGPLGSDQLRAGQTNDLAISALSFFGTGFMAGVAAEYSGSNELAASGGYSRTLPLLYPIVLGEPLTISQVYLPAVIK